MKAYLIVNKHVKANNNPLLEGVFWKKKHARAFARQLILKTGILDYKFLYSIITYKFEEKPFEADNNVTANKHIEVILHSLITNPSTL